MGALEKAQGWRKAVIYPQHIKGDENQDGEKLTRGRLFIAFRWVLHRKVAGTLGKKKQRAV